MARDPERFLDATQIDHPPAFPGREIVSFGDDRDPLVWVHVCEAVATGPLVDRESRKLSAPVALRWPFPESSLFEVLATDAAVEQVPAHYASLLRRFAARPSAFGVTSDDEVGAAWVELLRAPFESMRRSHSRAGTLTPPPFQYEDVQPAQANFTEVLRHVPARHRAHALRVLRASSGVLPVLLDGWLDGHDATAS